MRNQCTLRHSSRNFHKPKTTGGMVWERSSLQMTWGIEAIIKSLQDLERKCGDLREKHPADPGLQTEAKAIARWAASKCNELQTRYAK
jgi:hypothetical protein